VTMIRAVPAARSAMIRSAATQCCFVATEHCGTDQSTRGGYASGGERHTSKRVPDEGR